MVLYRESSSDFALPGRNASAFLRVAHLFSRPARRRYFTFQPNAIHNLSVLSPLTHIQHTLCPI